MLFEVKEYVMKIKNKNVVFSFINTYLDENNTLNNVSTETDIPGNKVVNNAFLSSLGSVPAAHAHAQRASACARPLLATRRHFVSGG